ncbi:hypothetical protein, partial [Promicromonospora sp. NPDC057488]|uniref:hypothetical protein n=1 Tax=Promicromonospora sp. NPDC057488 TaxID=3346147 RepID=UPI003672F19C
YKRQAQACADLNANCRPHESRPSKVPNLEGHPSKVPNPEGRPSKLPNLEGHRSKLPTPGRPHQHRAGGSGQDDAAFDELDPLDEDPEELDEDEDDEDELDEDDPESLDDEEEDEEDSDFPAFTVLLVEVLRESVR